MEALAVQLRGRRVGDFLIGDEIGAGGMGAAYRAEQVTLRREVVVKVIAPGGVTDANRVRFLREARLASHFDHPYAAHVYAFGAEPDGLLWIAMELVRGVPLDRLVAEQGPLPLARFVPLFERLCEVVHSAHEQGIIHRDIKPSNIMVVRRAGRMLPKLLDFGIARALASMEPVEPPPRAIAGDATFDQTIDGLLADATATLDQPAKSITARGIVVGSPPYMAPEQWVDATRADARTDLYALGATAFELLTGRLPYPGTTVMQIARGHARSDVPSLGAGLPAALDRVVGRALAKRADARYPDVLALSSAIREAVRESVAAPGPGELDEVVRDAFVHGGPQPVAETLLELAAAATPSAAWDAAWKAIGVVIRTCGAIAFAARARVGDHAQGDPAVVRFRALVDRGLDLGEWIALVGDVLAPYAERPQMHPVPELVALFWDGSARRSVVDDFRAVDDTEAGALDHDGVRRAVGELAHLLRAAAFLTDHGWIVAGKGGGERWMGARRSPRDPAPAPAGAAPGSVWLVDADGLPLLELSPIATAAPPAPGADDELFLLDGPAKRGARAIAWPREFERHDDALRAFVDAHLAPLGDRDASAKTEEERAPYRGLSTFGPGDAAMYFGREREVEAVVNRLRVQPLLAVVGPSGVGKSSFVHAGVVPAMPEAWHVLVVRPGASPLTALEARLASAGGDATGLADKLGADPGALREALLATGKRLGSSIILVVDQLEEMFTQCRDAATREAFGKAIAAAAAKGDAAARVVLTLRDDFLVRAAELPGLGDVVATSLELLTLPDPAMLRRILVEPLARVGYTFEDPARVDAMVAAVRDRPGALALLSFAASKLWEQRDRRFRHLPNRAYDAIGGVAGALAQHAEETLAALPEADRGLVRELFRHLVTSEGTRAVLRRDEALELLGKTAAAERVIEALVERRLLVGYEGDGGTDWIEVIHEALLSAWPRLVEWQREDAEGARMRDQLRAAARLWGERGRSRSLLWRGEALVEYRLWRARQPGGVTDLERAFADASIADDTRSRRIRRGLVAGAFVALVIGLVILQRASSRAQKSAADARRTTVALLAEQGRAALVADKPQEAMVYLSAAYSRGSTDPNLGFLLGVAGRELGGQLATLRGHTAGIRGVWFTPDGKAVTASMDGSTRVWDPATGAALRTFERTGPDRFASSQVVGTGLLVVTTEEPPAMYDLATGTRRYALATKPATPARVTDDGATIVTVDAPAGKLALWSAADGALVRELAVPMRPRSPLLTVRGGRFAVASADGVLVGSIADPGAPLVRLAMSSPARSIDLTDDGARVLSVPEHSRTVDAWDLARPDARITLAGHAADVLSARFSPDGARIATAGLDRTAKIWEARTGELLLSLEGHEGYIVPLEWSPDGALVATGSIDRTAKLWDARTGATRATYFGAADIVFRLAFDATGERLLVGSLDGIGRVFSTRRATTAAELRHPGGGASLRFSADGRRLVAQSDDHVVVVYDVATRAEVARIDAFRTPPAEERLQRLTRRLSLDVSPDGAELLVPVADGVRVVSVADPARARSLGPLPGTMVARYAPGGRVVAGTNQGEVAVFAASGALERKEQPHTGAVTDLELDPTGRIVSIDARGHSRVAALDGSEAHELPAVNGVLHGVALTRDGAYVAIAGQDTVVRVYAMATGAQRAASHGMSDLQDVAFSADEHRLAVANTDGTIGVYDSADGRLLAAFGDRLGWASAVAFSPDGALLAAADDTGRIQLWTIPPENRSPALVAGEVRCLVPLALRETRLVAAPIDASCP
jgi:WD40 repeat protein